MRRATTSGSSICLLCNAPPAPAPDLCLRVYAPGAPSHSCTTYAREDRGALDAVQG